MRYKDESWLREMYIDKELSATDIAERCDCGSTTIYRWLKRHEIERRNPSESHNTGETPPYQKEEWLCEKYHNEGMTAYEMASVSEVDITPSCIYKWMSHHGIERREQKRRVPPKLEDKEKLEHLYHKEELTAEEIGEMVDRESHTVIYWLQKHDIETRNVDYWRNTPDILMDKEKLRQLYFDEDLTQAEIGEQIDAAEPTVGKWLRRHGLQKDMGGPNNSQWNGRRVGYGEGWNEEKREEVRERDDRMCHGCGMGEDEHLSTYSERLHVHHIQPARQFDCPEERNAKDNLISLCRNCHYNWEEMAPLRPVTNLQLDIDDIPDEIVEERRL